MLNKLILYVLIFSIISSCTAVTVLQKINRTEVEVEVFESDKKLVLFIPMIHIGKQEFYNSVYKTVDSLKAAGFVAFHEGTIEDSLTNEQVDEMYQWLSDHDLLQYYRGSANKDSIADDAWMKKLRKMMGFYRDSFRYTQVFHEKGIFKDMVDQPRFHEMKTDARDLNVDVSIYDIIEEYERRFGEIELKSTDIAHLLTSQGSLANSERVPISQVKEIILDYRDEYLAKQIQNSPHNNIVVIYGLAHVPGTLAHLQRLDKSWKMLKRKK